MIETGTTKMNKSPSPNLITVSSFRHDWGASCSTEPKQNTPLIYYKVNDFVLIRYVFKKKIQYFVGQTIVKLIGKYQVSIFKKSGRNYNIYLFIYLTCTALKAN